METRHTALRYSRSAIAVKPSLEHIAAQKELAAKKLLTQSSRMQFPKTEVY